MRLSDYHGDASDLAPEVFQYFLDDLAAGVVPVPINQVLELHDIAKAHPLMEAGTGSGKIVVRVLSFR